MSEPSAPPIPEPLLVPLMDCAAEYLRSLEPEDIPGALRPLVGFDRRGLVRGAARHQILRAFETDDNFRKLVVEDFLERPEINAVLGDWRPSQAMERVEQAAARADLPLLASALFAARPQGWSYALGACVASFTSARIDREEQADARAFEQRINTLEEANRRVQEQRRFLERQVASLDDELKAERRERRNRELEAQGQVAETQKEMQSVQTDAERAQRELSAAHEGVQRERERSRQLHEEVNALRRDLRLAQEEIARGGLGLRQADFQNLQDASDLARRLSTGLASLAERARRSQPQAPEKSRTGKQRIKTQVPAGLTLDDPQALDAMLREKGVQLIIDGYNITMQAWQDIPVTQQRERLIAALSALANRTKCDITVIFDGSDVEGARPLHRPGVHVAFSAPGEEADVMVVREVAGRPVHVPIVVASSDSWVREHSEAEGARVVPARTLIGVLT